MPDNGGKQEGSLKIYIFKKSYNNSPSKLLKSSNFWKFNNSKHVTWTNMLISKSQSAKTWIRADLVSYKVPEQK